MIGTPAYMSPEQAGGMAVDQRSDIYSLGAIMYELFCGQPLFRGRSFGEFVRKHLTELPIPPRQTSGGANIDERLEALIMHSLAKDPEERYGHILELRDGLLHFLGGIETHPGYSTASSGSRMLPLTASATTPPISSSRSDQSAESSAQRASTHHSQTSPADPQPLPWWVWLVGGTCAVGIGIGSAVWYAGRTAPTHVTAPATAPLAPPSTPPSPPTTPPALTLHFDSLPSGGVYADGHSAELCRTPCEFNLDLKDGEPLDHRTFVVRSDGYRDKAVTVDLAGSQREFNVTLERVEPDPKRTKPVVKPYIKPKPRIIDDTKLERPR